MDFRKRAVLTALGVGLVACSANDSNEVQSQADALAVEENGVAVDDSGAALQLPRSTRRQMTSEEIAESGAKKAALNADVPAAPVRSRPTPKPILDRAAELSAETLMTVIVKLDAPPMFADDTLDTQSISRAAIVARRKDQVLPDQRRVAARINALGGQVTTTFWLGGSSLVAQLPASQVKALLGIPGVVDVREAETASGSANAWFDVGDGRPSTAMRTQTLIDNGYEGNVNNRVNSANPIKIGLIEFQNMLDPGHVGFNDGPGPSSRVRNIWRCDSPGGCTADPGGSAGTHGTSVASVALGDISQGQDPAFPGTLTAAQIARSGHSTDAELYYYDFDAGQIGFQSALQTAVADGVDVINMSFNSGGLCDADHEYVNQALTDARAAGVLLVAATGNQASTLTDPCEVGYPALRPDVLAVGGLLSNDDSVVYRDLTIGLNCAVSLGGMTITSHDGSTGTATVLGLMAPGFLQNMYGQHPATYVSGCGSSFAAPAVAGAAADFMDALRDLGWSQGNSASFVYANMLLMGDAYDGQALGPSNASIKSSRPTRHSGFGRTRMKFPASGGLSGPWYWHTAKYIISQNDVVSIPVNTTAAEPAGITEYKAVATWFPSNLNDVPDIDMYLYNVCTGSVQVASDTSRDYHSRVRLEGSDASGKCLEVRLKGFSVPAGGTAVYFAQMYHGGPL